MTDGKILDPRDRIIRSLYLENARLKMRLAGQTPRPKVRMIECSGGKRRRARAAP